MQIFGKNNTNPDNLYNKILANLNVKDALNILLREYNQSLIDIGYGITRPQLLKLDKIDLRNILIYKNDRHNCFPDFDHISFDRELLSKNYWYCYVPCFSSGIFQLNTTRYLKFEVKDLDFTNRSYTVTAQDYLRHESYWEIGIRTTATLQFPIIDPAFLISPETMAVPWQYVAITVTDHVPFCDIYKLIPYDKLNWSDAKIAYWEEKIIPYAESIEEKMYKYKQHGSGENIIHAFLFATVLSNEILQQYKPKAERKPKSTTQAKVKTEPGTDIKTPKKIVRTIGPISMKSEKPPKPSTRETVIKYKTPTWKARGGVRHMKDGRTIPFKESIHRRKCLIDQNKDTPVPQTILELKNNKKNNNKKGD